MSFTYYIISNPTSFIVYYRLSLNSVSSKPLLKYSTINITQTEIHATPHYIKTILPWIVVLSTLRCLLIVKIVTWFADRCRWYFTAIYFLLDTNKITSIGLINVKFELRTCSLFCIHSKALLKERKPFFISFGPFERFYNVNNQNM